jgi:hypothetical protein
MFSEVFRQSVLLQKLAIAQKVTKFHSMYEILRFINSPQNPANGAYNEPDKSIQRHHNKSHNYTFIYT